MRVLHYDCSAGISGDMNLAALIHLGVPVDFLQETLKGLHIHDEWEIQASSKLCEGITGTQITVTYHEHTHHDHGDQGFAHSDHHHHRTFGDIKKMIETSHLSTFVQKTALDIFYRLAVAEGSVHGKKPEDVHFHEVGAVDSIIDIVGAAICLEYLNIDHIVSTSVELGSGSVKCAHGIMPVPAPATAELARNFPTSLGGTTHEATTPTGAAFLASVVNEYNSPIDGKILAIGTGIGHRQGLPKPNILRVMLLETSSEKTYEVESMCELHANIDDMTAEQISYLTTKLLEGGAKDVWQIPIVMKKNRLAHQVCVLCTLKDKETMLRLFFYHSTSLGIREYSPLRHQLERDSKIVNTSLGSAHVKTSYMAGETHRHKPEYDDCVAIADKTGLSLSQCQMLAHMQRLREDAKDEQG